MRAVILLALVAVASAHLCLLSPLQRAPNNDFNTVGASDCAIITGPCGSSSARSPQVFYESGTNTTIVFQKNENHWIGPSTPGNFTVYWVLPHAMVNAGFVADGNTPSGTIYTLVVKVPPIPSKTGVLQVIYNTANPQVPAQFFQCADIGIF